MKLKAIILLLCFSVYFIDNFAAASSKNMKTEKSMCCKMKAKMPAHQSCPQKHKDCGNSCFNCPLFYSTTLPSVISISISSFQIEKRYTILPQQKTRTYHTEIWKPPNSI